MKKSKWELALEAWKDTLKYLENHRTQGRILFTGISLFLFLLALNISAKNLVIIIDALK